MATKLLFDVEIDYNVEGELWVFLVAHPNVKIKNYNKFIDNLEQLIATTYKYKCLFGDMIGYNEAENEIYIGFRSGVPQYNDLTGFINTSKYTDRFEDALKEVYEKIRF